jgi:BRCA1 C Terminus (BRCT) domain
MGFFKQTDRAPSAAMTSGRRLERTTDELIGICRGVLCDGHVSRPEALFLNNWIERNSAFVDTYPFNHLLDHLHHALEHGVMDSHDESDLLETLSKFVGGEANGEHNSESASLSTALPLDDPEPSPLEFASTFVVTGTFKFGPRKIVASRIAERGGIVAASVSKKVRYLIVGEIGSRDWIHSSYGRKIEEARDLRAEGARLSIICERHWTQFMGAPS